MPNNTSVFKASKVHISSANILLAKESHTAKPSGTRGKSEGEWSEQYCRTIVETISLISPLASPCTKYLEVSSSLTAGMAFSNLDDFDHLHTACLLTSRRSSRMPAK